MKPWKQITRRTVLDGGKFLRVDEHEVLLPNGRVIRDWPMVVTPDYVNILARDTDGRYLFFRQTKYAAPQMQLSPPGGYIEPGEEPLAGAKRELLEETGYASEQWIDLGHYVVDGNRGCGTAHLFLALDAAMTSRHPSDDLEDQEFILMTRDELESAIDRNDCSILSIAALLGLGLRRLDQLPPGPSTAD